MTDLTPSQQAASAVLCSVAEEWRDVPGTGGLYRASTGGAVVGPKGRILKCYLDTGGYPFVSVTIDGVRISRAVHRIIAETFIGPRPDGHDIDHIDADRLNSRLENLRYLPRAENRAQGGFRSGGNRRLTEASATAILRLVRDTKPGQSHPNSMASIAQRYGVSIGTVHNLLTGKSWKHLRSEGASL